MKKEETAYVIIINGHKIEIFAPEGYELKNSRSEGAFTTKIEFVPKSKSKSFLDYAAEYFTVARGIKVHTPIPMSAWSFSECCGILKLICDEYNKKSIREWNHCDPTGVRQFNIKEYHLCNIPHTGTLNEYTCSYENGNIKTPFSLYSLDDAREIIELCGTEFMNKIFK